MQELSLYAKFHYIFTNIKIKNKTRSKLISIFNLYNRNEKLQTEKNYKIMHKIADGFIKPQN